MDGNVVSQMNFLVLTGVELRERQALQEQVSRLRHKFFVEKLGWEAIRRSNGLDIDEFDTDAAIHVTVQDGDKIGAYGRLLSTTQPHLLSAIYPTLLDDALKMPVGDDTLEWTRSTALPIKPAPGSD